MDESKLMDMAVAARENSYSPYSGFAVGAALLCSDGCVYTGCNIENAAFGPTNCAERTAFFKAVSEGKKSFSKIAVAGGPKDGGPASGCAPCGVCRQVMLEFCGGDFEIILYESPDACKTYTLGELIPLGFRPAALSQ